MTQAPVPANNKPENISKDVPAMYQASILYSPPTLGYYWGWIAYYEPDRLPRMLKEVGERTAELALKSFDVAIKAMGVHEPPPLQRLELYRVKPTELWMEQQAKFPWRYEHDMLDWQKLEQEHPLNQPAPTLPEVTDDTVIPEEPRPKKLIKKPIRNEQGRIDRVEEYYE